MLRYLLYIVLLSLILFGIIYLQSNHKEKRVSMDRSRPIKIVSNENIFFGHRSVGENIIQGMKTIISENDSNNFKISTFHNNIDFKSYYFLEKNIGNNGHPKSKIDDFLRIVSHLAKNDSLNIAMMKLCFVDITKNTDINEVFRYYVNTIDSLENKYPNLNIIHFTVPLTAEQPWYRKIISFIKGTSTENALNNFTRYEYNQMLTSYYPKEQIFDLAGIESTYPDGSKDKNSIKGKSFYNLVGDYTEDGGHLNKTGKYLVASRLLTFLSNFISQKANNFSQNKLY